MDKAEVLERSRMENRHGDERDRGITIESGTWGAVSLAAATAVVFLVRMLSKGGRPSDLLAILFAYLAAANAYKWSRTRSGWTLLVTALYSALALGWLCAYAVVG
ncbi:Uncharacterised protein [Collinsella intestinalis]|nr:Uncharacterised protein [Collinsella intestinalis]